MISRLLNMNVYAKWLTLLLLPLLFVSFTTVAYGQEGTPVVDEAELDALAAPPSDGGGEAPAARGISFLTLLSQGGPLMIPIGVMSLLVVTLAVERFFGLRAGSVIPSRLVRELDAMSRKPDNFDPQAALVMCHKYPSAASRVVQTMLLRTGRPVADIELAGAEAAQREADRLGGPNRWLVLAAAVTPLIGLFGTVLGMILAFHNLTDMPAGQNKAEALAEGIYTALVTTVGGLAVAIPATIFAHWYEGRLLRLMRRIEELAFRVAPGLERFHGRMRLDADGHLTNISVANSSTGSSRSAPAAPPPPPPPTASIPKVRSGKSKSA